MKKSAITLLILMMSIKSFGQVPSNATVIKQIRKRFPVGKIQLNGSSTSKKRKGIVWHYYYWRHFTLSKKSGNLVGKIKSAIIYEKFGNKYVFDNYATITTEVEGMKFNKKEVSAYLNNNLEDFLSSKYNDIVNEIPVIIIPKNTKFNWDSPDMVTFNTQVTYSSKTSYTDVEKATHIYSTMLFRDSKTKKWNRILASEIEGDKKIISKKKYTTNQMDALKTLDELLKEKKSSKKVKGFSSVEEPPVFKSDKQLFYYIHDRLLASTPQKAKAYLYKVLSKNNFQSGSTLNGYTQMWVDKIINNLNPFQYTYCQYPKIKEEYEGVISFYDKEKTKSVRYRAVKENGTWKLKEMTYYVPSSDAVNRLAKKIGNCGEKPNIATKEKVTYKIGAIVNVTFSNGVFPAKVTKQDSNFSNRYYIKLLDGGRGYWVTDDKMVSSTTTQNQPKNTGIKKITNKVASFKMNDHVGVRTRSGVIKGKIIKTTGSNYLIKLDKKGYQDMWVKKEHLVKL